MSQGQAVVSRCGPETLLTLTGKLPLKNLNIYSGSPTGNLYAFNAAQGTIRWCTHITLLPQQIFSTLGTRNPPLENEISVLAVTNEVVYASSNNGYLYAFKARDGLYLWSRETGRAYSFFQSIIDNSILYVSGPDGLYALNAHSGRLLWHSELGFPPLPPMVTDTGIFVQSEDGNATFDLLHPQDGVVLAQMDITGDGHYSPPISSVVLAP